MTTLSGTGRRQAEWLQRGTRCGEESGHATLAGGGRAGLPLAIGATGSTHPGDVVGGWRFLLWTLPDLAASLALLAVVAMMLGIAKLFSLASLTRPGRVRRGA